VTLKTPSNDVALVLKSGRLRALGLVTDGKSLARSVASDELIGAGQTRVLTFLFEAPLDTRTGRLTIRGVGSAPVPKLRSATIAPSAIMGRFDESPPRNLKPLMRNPVMAAIQAAGHQRIHVRRLRREKGLHVFLEPLRMRSVASPAGNGVYNVTFTHEKHKLRCKLRLARGGRTLILYLADKPFHQITYAKAK